MEKDIIIDTIAAIATPPGEGGIGIVRLSGPAALTIADNIISLKDGRRLSAISSYTLRYGHVVDRGRIVDEALIAVMRAPKSYTREDVVEINCHGGMQALRETIRLTVRMGARIASPGEFTKRAFLNGRIDLAQAEAVLDTIRAKTEYSLKAAARQLEGGLSMEIDKLRESIVSIAAEVEAAIDFPEEEIAVSGTPPAHIDAIIAAIKRLIDTSVDGMILRDGALAVICGKPNVGKSSLMNLLLKKERVIVTAIPGTTRDAVEEMIDLRGIPVRLVDTAGIATTDDLIECEGIRRAKWYMDQADIILIVFDNSAEIDEKDIEVIRCAMGKKRIVIINKSDLPAKLDRKKLALHLAADALFDISVSQKVNIDLLEEAIAGMIWSGKVSREESEITINARHRELLDKALKNMLSVKEALALNSGAELIAVDLKEALYHLGLIVGKSVAGDILDRIFERFCIGK